MKLTNQFDDQRVLTRLVWLALVAVILLTLAFSGYYYWDRYIHLGDQSPLEQNATRIEMQVRENPEDVESRVALAQTYMQSGRFDEAIDQAGEILEAYPEHHGALFVQGMAFAQSGQTAAAIEPLSKLTILRRESPMAQTDTMLEIALYYLGKCYLEVGRDNYAISALTEALEINQTDADAMYLLGLAYTQNEQPEMALAQFQNAVRFVPAFTEAYQGMVDSYATLGQDDFILYAQGMVAYANNDFDSAQTYLESAVAMLPEFGPAFLGLGLTYEQLGQLEAAQIQLEQALALEPDNFLATHALGRVQHILAESG